MARRMMGIGFGSLDSTFPETPTPGISSVSPTSGINTGGTSVTITMTRTNPGSAVTIGGNAATITSASYGDNGFLIVTTPAGTAGARDVVVSDSIGSATLAAGFTYSAGAALTAGSATASGGDTEVNLSATAPAGGTAPYTYQWYFSTTSGQKGSTIAGATSLSYTHTGRTNGVAYYYTLDATDSAGSPATVSYTQKTATPGSFAAPNVASTDFESGNSGVFLAGVPPVNTGSVNIDFVADPTGELTGTVARMRFQSGAGDGVVARDVKVKYTHATGYGLGTTFYFRGHVVVPTPAADMLNGQRKLFYIQTQSNGADAFFFLKAEPAISGGQTLKLEFPKYPTGNMAPSAGSIQFNTKHSIEVQITVNSSISLADGIVRVWVDGAMTYEKTDAYPMRTLTKGNFKVFCFGDQCQASLSADIAFDEYRYWDNLAISTARIGPG
jgi:hypothetical protein